MKSVTFALVVLAAAAPFAMGEPQVAFEQRPGELIITVAGRPIATYCYKDATIPRPYFAHLCAPSGVQVTRNHPPKEGDAQDHDTMHPGMWLAFGDISGNDYWRLNAKVEGGEFLEEPSGGLGKGTFAVRNRYLANDGESVVCTEVCRYTVAVISQGYLFLAESAFTSEGSDFYFGDQEEMGLGIRMATPVAVKSGQGGRILDSEGRLNEAQIWGKQAKWCDYSGVIEGKHAGMCIMPAPDNFRVSWWHARDYGFVAANPFGVHAFTGGPASRIVVKEGETFRLRYAVLVHDGLERPAEELQHVYELVFSAKEG